MKTLTSILLKMKHLWIILLFIPTFLYGQVNSGLNDIDFEKEKVIRTIERNELDSANVKLLSVDTLYHEPIHYVSVLSDSACEIVAGTHIQITNGDSLWRVLDDENGMFLSGDTILIPFDGSYWIELKVTGYAVLGADWHTGFGRKRDGITVYNSDIGEFTTSGATNKEGRSIRVYSELLRGDKIWAVLSKTGGPAGNFILTVSSFNIYEYYKV